jgi:nicotinate-nucleotide pyrophosphorylase (carboxylating)
VNHRIGLHDAVLIKENHIAAAGGVTWCCPRPRPRRRAPLHRDRGGDAGAAGEALDAGAKMVLLDNMDLPTLREAVRNRRARHLEISGGVTLDGCARAGGNRRGSHLHRRADQGREGHGFLHAPAGLA